MTEDKVAMDLDSAQRNEDWLRNDRTRKLAAKLRERCGIAKPVKDEQSEET